MFTAALVRHSGSGQGVGDRGSGASDTLRDARLGRTGTKKDRRTHPLLACRAHHLRARDAVVKDAWHAMLAVESCEYVLDAS